MKCVKIIYYLICIVSHITATAQKKTPVFIVHYQHSPRVLYGIEQLSNALKAAGYVPLESGDNKITGGSKVIIIGLASDRSIRQSATSYRLAIDSTGKEGFSIHSNKDITLLAGADPSGILYGCMELAEQIEQGKTLFANLAIHQQPEMVLRGTCIGLQKPYYLPGRTVYEYPYTPETFPWLYDRKLWLQMLDSMAANRMNSLYLWNGHPFASLVRVKEYPYALEVDDATFKKNEDLYQFLTREADKRGIWVIQMFYNIIVSKPFAEKHHIKTQDRNRPIIPLVADYTRKSIAAFVAKYPNVGLMVCLGEAMEGVGQDDVDWFTQTIIPGVRDGLKLLDRKDEPPIVLRAHDTDAPRVMKAALPLYSNLYTEAKYNGEALTTYTPRGPWAELHRKLSHIGTVQIENIHIMANLEPFRYGSPDFMQKCVQAMHGVYEANGLHLYPQASYWDWPYTADKTPTRLLQIERDWIWYKAWSRYAWNCHRSREEEVAFWSNELAVKYGCSPGQAKNILEAYEQSGEIAPKLLRRYGITDGNRQTLTLGMLMTQLINPRRYGLYTLLYNSEGPEGEMLIEYAEKESKQEPHVGETPVQVADEVVEHGNKAVEAIEKAATSVTVDKAEFQRLKNDMYCYRALANFYAKKARAALYVLNYKYSHAVTDLEKALPLLQQSVKYFKELATLTDNTYLYANSMQTQQRKIPVGGNDAKNKTWVELLPFYEKELQQFTRHIDSLKHPQENKVAAIVHLKPATVEWAGTPVAQYTLQKEAVPFSDTSVVIKEIAPALEGLQAMRLPIKQQAEQGTALTFTTNTPVTLLVGYFMGKGAGYLPVPQLETDASANAYGQVDAKISNAIAINGMPSVNIHAYTFKSGMHTLTLGKGSCLLLGFVDGPETIPVYNAGLQAVTNEGQLDWLFE